MVKGKYVISAMVGIGMILAGFGWWVRYKSSQKVLAVWGPDAVVAIRTSDRAELLPVLKAGEGDAELGEGEPEETISIESSNYPVQSVGAGKAIDITEAPGLIHARHHLVHEKGFNWDAPREDGCEPKWTIAFRFTNNDKIATMLLDFECNRAYLVERKTEVGMRPIIADALKRFLADFDL